MGTDMGTKLILNIVQLVCPILIKIVWFFSNNLFMEVYVFPESKSLVKTAKNRNIISELRYLHLGPKCQPERFFYRFWDVPCSLDWDATFPDSVFKIQKKYIEAPRQCAVGDCFVSAPGRSAEFGPCRCATWSPDCTYCFPTQIMRHRTGSETGGHSACQKCLRSTKFLAGPKENVNAKYFFKF